MSVSGILILAACGFLCGLFIRPAWLAMLLSVLIGWFLGPVVLPL
jgi:hypothetical protein